MFITKEKLKKINTNRSQCDQHYENVIRDQKSYADCSSAAAVKSAWVDESSSIVWTVIMNNYLCLMFNAYCLLWRNTNSVWKWMKIEIFGFRVLIQNFEFLSQIMTTVAIIKASNCNVCKTVTTHSLNNKRLRWLSQYTVWVLSVLQTYNHQMSIE